MTTRTIIILFKIIITLKLQ